jgi:hypothetical protein
MALLYHSRLNSGCCLIKSLTFTIQRGSASAPSHWLSLMMMLYSCERVASVDAAFWNSAEKGASAKVKLTS